MDYNEKTIREHYRGLTKLLIEKNLTITTMESATSGQIASLITDTEGSSAILKGAFITYCNEAKIQQGVPAEILDKFTVYSRETAEAMAAACNRRDRHDGQRGSCQSGGVEAGAGIFCHRCESGRRRNWHRVLSHRAGAAAVETYVQAGGGGRGVSEADRGA